MEPQRMPPGQIERRAGQALAQRMRAGPRHAGGTRRAGDAAGFEQGGEEDALPGRRPMRAGR